MPVFAKSAFSARNDLIGNNSVSQFIFFYIFSFLNDTSEKLTTMRHIIVKIKNAAGEAIFHHSPR